MDVSFEDVFGLEVFDDLLVALQVRLHVQEHLDHGKGLEWLSDRFYLFAAVRTVLLLFEPVWKTASTVDVEARSKLNWLVKQLVANAALVLLDKPLYELVVTVWLQWLLLCRGLLNWLWLDRLGVLAIKIVH